MFSLPETSSEDHMLKECLEVFEYMLKEEGESLILHSYVPADGTYILVGRDGSQKAVMDFCIDKKTKKVDHSHPSFDEFCFYDYHSQLLSMNKPVDRKKIIHSNNYLSFFVKKEANAAIAALQQRIADNLDRLVRKVRKKQFHNLISCLLISHF